MPVLLEVNFAGRDPAQGPAGADVLEDDHLPVPVFGALSLAAPGYGAGFSLRVTEGLSANLSSDLCAGVVGAPAHRGPVPTM